MRKLPALSAVLALFALFLTPKVFAAPVICDPDPGTDMNIQYGDAVTCQSEADGDVDTFHFVGSAGDKVHISAYRSASVGSWCLELYGPDAQLIKNSLCNSAPKIEEPLVEDGIHTVLVQGSSSASDPYGYVLEVPCVAGKCVGGLPPGTLGYTAVDPCRIVDTRYGVGGSMSVGEIRHFHTYGDITDQNKDGGGAPANYPDECPFALGEHAAVHMNISVLPLVAVGVPGYLTVWPHGAATVPTAGFLAFQGGQYGITNAGTVKTHAVDGATPDISVLAGGDLHLIIEVLGYYTQ